MHGRIVQYSHSTGSGIIINNHKKLFDFKLINWHDKTRIPEINLLVEFKCDEDNNLSVISVKSSHYQAFGKDSIIKEADFWRTLSDDELEKLELGVFEDLIAKVCKETNYEALSDIKPSISIENFIKYHFEAENHIIQIALQLPTNGYELLDYRILTRFLMRTLDSLIYTEKRITKDTFSAYLEIYSKLQYFVTPFYKASQNSAKIYELFLSQQLYFTAAQRKLINIKDDLLRVENKLHITKSQIFSNEQKLSNSQNKQQNEVRMRLEKLQSQLKELSEGKIRLTKLKEKLEKMIEAFKGRYEAHFAKCFDGVREKIFEQIKLALNTTITSLDNKMWDLGMNSDPIKNHYFKLGTNYSFCILAFVLQYIKMLDTGKMSDNDRILHSYISRYQQRNTKNILIVSSDDKLKNKLKMKLFNAYKDFSITTTEKKMEYEIIIANQRFDFVIIDNCLEDGVAIEMVIFGKSKKHNKSAKFIIYQIPKVV